jgi:hypothetical protein
MIRQRYKSLIINTKSRIPLSPPLIIYFVKFAIFIPRRTRFFAQKFRTEKCGKEAEDIEGLRTCAIKRSRWFGAGAIGAMVLGTLQAYV